MNDERLTEVGNDQVRYLSTEGDTIAHRLFDGVRYHLLLLVQLFQTITALAMVLSALLFLGTQSGRFVVPVAINGAAFLAAYVLNEILQTGWWWTDG